LKKLDLKFVFAAGGDFNCLKPETNTRRYFTYEENKMNSNFGHPAPAPNALQLLLDDDILASSCQSLAQYRSVLSNQLREIYSRAPTAPVGDQKFTAGMLTAPVTDSGRAFGLIPEGKGWADDLINWSTREFRNPADAVRLAKCWNACVYATPEQLQLWLKNGHTWTPALDRLDLARLRNLLSTAHDVLASTCDSDLDHFENDEEEMEGAPVQYAARTLMQAIDSLDPLIPGESKK
jgi:hypothetical protein